MTDPRFDVGDRVVDTEQPEDERGVAVVLDADAGRADAAYIEALDATVADVNDCPPDDRVVTVAFERWLAAHVPEYDEYDGDDFGDRLDAFLDMWGIPSQSYDYPESRLAPAPDPDDD